MSPAPGINPAQALGQLAAHCGVTSEYCDIQGRRHVTSVSTCNVLVAAMHVPADVEPDVLLDEMTEREWRQPLPTVQVLRLGNLPVVPVSLPAILAGRRYRWLLTPEQGVTMSGEFVPAELPQLASRRIGGVTFQRSELTLPPLALTGYYRLEVEPCDGEGIAQAAMKLVMAPAMCYQPGAIKGEGRVWGPSLQLYSLRSRRNWGIGDFSDLRAVVDMAADSGAGVLGLNPLHALFADDASRISPYSPSDRRFVNFLYLDVEAVPDFAECHAARNLVSTERFQARLRRLRACELVAYPEVAAVKREVLELLFRHFHAQHLADQTDRARAFLKFRNEQGAALETFSRFEALQQHFRDENPDCWGWPAWPKPYRDPASPVVAAFAEQHAEAVEFFAWLQWLADEQLAGAGQQSWRRGLGVGIYQDLAVGASPGGAETWAWQQVFADGAYIGAPPDEFSSGGQDWGLQPFVPHRLRQAGYEPFIALLRANMRHSGALRMDHVMALTRVFWVPAGGSPAQGAYVAYTVDDLLGILALESHRNRCLVIGEDLGTVPDGFRDQLAMNGILSYRPLLFERNSDGGFKAPADYPRQALSAVSTHDLPTLRGFWKGSDLDTRSALKLLTAPEHLETLVLERAKDRARFLIALQREGLLPDGASVHPVSVPAITPAFMLAIHAYLARTPARLVVVQPEDILGVAEQVNLPGSSDAQHPNWRRRLPLDIEDWLADSRFVSMGTMMRRERGSAVVPHDEPTPQARQAIIPRATYRLQFNRAFTFVQAGALTSYLAKLGVSHCYASSFLQARPGSNHGYDIVNHSVLNPEIGTPEEFEGYVAELKAHGLEQILDVVPNHMGVMGADNSWWLDVLENGPASSWGAFFDIDWKPLNPDLWGKVLLPLLGDHYGAVLKRGELRLEFDAARAEFSLYYYQHRLPIDPESYSQIIRHRSEYLAASLGEDDRRYVELQTLLNAFDHLPARTEVSPTRMLERQRDKEVHKRQLAVLCANCADILHHIGANLTEFNGRPGDGASFDLLHELIKRQGYRLAYWRVASDEINYRRFFDINDLAALRMENAAVFDATHHYVLELISQGKVVGLRIDHPDGLYDPGEYFHRLQQAIGGPPTAPDTPLPLYLVIEKILADHERLPGNWPIHGATGYRFANLVNNLLVDATTERRMTRVYRDFVDAAGDFEFEQIAFEAKKLIMHTALSSELNVLATLVARIAAGSRETCDYTLNGLREALVELVACFPVYRTYLSHGQLSHDDRRHIAWASAMASKRNPAADGGIFEFLQSVLTMDIARDRSASYRARVEAFAMKFQQFTSPVMAKGVEDTAFYRYHRLTSLNDVGADPSRFGISVAAFHAATRERAGRWPHNMLATSTHDSKRAEDVRARITVLSEIPAAWKLMLKRWSRLNRGRKRVVDGIEAPSRNDEYLLYQTLIGTWPLEMPEEPALDDYRVRIEGYMIKALREAKEHSNWIRPNADYEAAVSGFIRALLAPGEKNLFLADFVPQVQPIIRYGLLNSLAQTLIKLVSPGVPDIYQGCELWQFNLVDPDNRRPVDFTQRSQLLEEVTALVDGPPAQWSQRLQPLAKNMADGRIKLYTLWRSLTLRARWPDVFADGRYLALTVHGVRAANICAFARVHGDRVVIALVPRLPARLLGDRHEQPAGDAVWGNTVLELPAGLAATAWCNTLTGECHDASRQLGIGKLLAFFPVALLASVPASEP